MVSNPEPSHCVRRASAGNALLAYTPDICFGLSLHPMMHPERRVAMNCGSGVCARAMMILIAAAAAPGFLEAQESTGPQTNAPPAVAQPLAPLLKPGPKLTVPSGTRLAV